MTDMAYRDFKDAPRPPSFCVNTLEYRYRYAWPMSFCFHRGCTCYHGLIYVVHLLFGWWKHLNWAKVFYKVFIFQECMNRNRSTTDYFWVLTFIFLLWKEIDLDLEFPDLRYSLHPNVFAHFYLCIWTSEYTSKDWTHPKPWLERDGVVCQCMTINFRGTTVLNADYKICSSLKHAMWS